MVIQARLRTMTMRKQKLALLLARSHELVCCIEGLEEILKDISKDSPASLLYLC
jgi:hypothetical protein